LEFGTSKNDPLTLKEDQLVFNYSPPTPLPIRLLESSMQEIEKQEQVSDRPKSSKQLGNSCVRVRRSTRHRIESYKVKENKSSK
jgi:hypothetical protein